MAMTTGYGLLIDGYGLLLIWIAVHALPIRVLARYIPLLQMDGYTLSLLSIELPTYIITGHIKYMETQSSHNKCPVLERKCQGAFLFFCPVATHQRVSQWQILFSVLHRRYPNSHYSLSRRKPEARSTWDTELVGHLVLNAANRHCFCCNRCFFGCYWLCGFPTERELATGLSAIWPKIKIQILLEKLTCKRKSTVLCISRQCSLRNDQKNLSAQKKSLCLQKCCSARCRWLMLRLSVESCYLSGVWIISHRGWGSGGVNLERWATLWLSVLSGMRIPVL